MKHIAIILLAASIFQVNSLSACGGGLNRTWTGDISTDWDVSENWGGSCSVPGPAQTAIISGAIANQPVVSNSTTVGAVSFNQSGTLLVTAPATEFNVNSVRTSHGEQGTFSVQNSAAANVPVSLSTAGNIFYRLSNGASLTGNGQIDDGQAYISTEASGSGCTFVLSSSGTLSAITSLNQTDNIILNGDTTVLEGANITGKLNLNTNFIGNLNINGGALSGVGSVIGQLAVNGGTISPGNSIGTFTVNGNYSQAAGVYNVQIDSLGNSSLIDVSGSATLSPQASVSVISLDGGVSNTNYTILTADGGVSGTFGSVTAIGIARNPRLIYDANNVYLTFQNFLSLARTRNQINVAMQLDSITDPSPSLQTFLDQINSLDDEAIPYVYDELSGEQYVALLSSYEVSANQFQRRLNMLLRPLYANPCCRCPIEGCYQPWIEVGGSNLRLDKTSEASSSKQEGYTVSIGNQALITDCWTLGGAFSYEYDRLHFNHLHSSGNQNVYLGSLYTLYRTDWGYLLGSALTGYGDTSITRKIEVGDAVYRTKGKPKGLLSSFYVEAAKDYCIANILVQPFIGLDGGYFALGRFCERGDSPLNLKVHRKSYGVANTTLGGHFSLCPNQCGLEIGLDLDWNYRLTKKYDELEMNFQTFGNNFGIRGVSLGRNSVDAYLSAVKRINASSIVFLEVGGQWWEHANTYSILGGVQLGW